MNRSIAEILTESVTPEKFSETLAKTDGSFKFDLEAMLDFGKVYCSLYPESVDHSDSQQVVTGYKLVRILIIENLLKGMKPDLKSMYREILASASGVNRYLPEVITIEGRDTAVDLYRELDIRVKDIKEIIDSLPNGVVKERFTGGISVFYNTLYLMKKSLNI